MFAKTYQATHPVMMQGASNDDLRDRYLARLAERKARLMDLARAVGWHYHCHHTGGPAQPGLLFLYRALEGGR